MTAKVFQKFVLLILILVLTLIGLYFLSKSLSYQVFGEILNKVNTTQKVIALTFDDGPSAKTDTVLAILKNNNVKATFFLTGSSIQNNISATKKIVLAGHEIGNHSYSHNRLILKPYKTIAEEIEKTDSLIRAVGYKGNITFRPPYGKKLFILPYYLKQNNRKTIMWDIEPESIPEIALNSNKLTDYVIKKSKKGSIILMHVMYKGREKSIESLPKIIKGLKKKGYEFKTVSELLKYKKN